MTHTIQTRSQTILNNSGKDLTVKEPETEDNMSLLLQVLDSLNGLYEKLNRLNYVIQKKNMEQAIYRKGKTR
jgi:hypothetical protein